MENIKWLWSLMDRKYRKWHIMALCISAISSLALLINPTLQKRLVDDVIVAQNAEPLLGILFTMLAVRICHEGFRYLMVTTLERTSVCVYCCSNCTVLI